MLLASCSIKVKKHESTGEVTKEVKVGAFNGIMINLASDMEYIVSDTFRVVMTASQEDFDNLEECLVRDSMLIFNAKYTSVHGIVLGQSLCPQIKLKIYGPASLSSVCITGSSDFTCNDELQSEDMEVQIEGSGDVNIKGITCRNGNFVITGTGNINTTLHKTQQASYVITGSGDAALNCDSCEQVRFTITGAGSVVLDGTLRTLDKSITGSGNIKDNTRRF